MKNAVAFKTFGWIAICLALATFAVRNFQLSAVRDDVAALEQRSLHPLTRSSQSATGYQFGQRSEILTPDGCHWVMQTQGMLAEGNLRVREVAYDNYPSGRDVHWSASLHGWLAALAWLKNAVDDTPTPLAVEEMAVWASPALLLIFLAVALPFIWKWRGGAAAGLFALGMVWVDPIGDLFAFADPDHHGLVAIFGFCTVVFLLVGGGGWVREENSFKTARRWFVGSGITGGAGLWVSSATQVPVLIGIGLGAISGNWWFGRMAKKAKTTERPAPELWRAWGIAGASTSLFFYVLEYFPSHLGMRLEVNHPLYALAWLSAGELLFRTTRWIACGDFAKTSRELVLAWAAVMGLLLLPLTITFAGESTFWVGDRLLWALHRDYIVEFCSVFRRLGDVPPSRWLQTFSLLPILVMAISWRWLRGRIGVTLQARFMVGLVPALLFFCLSVYQVRWAGLCGMLWMVLLVEVAGLLTREEVVIGFSWRWKVALAVLALGVVLPWISETTAMVFTRAQGQKGISKMSLRFSVLRDLSRWLRSRVGSREAVVLCGPSATTALIYHGGFKGVGTLYWENKDGLHAMVDIFSTTNDDVARSLVRQHGITHIVVVSWDAFAAESTRLALGLRRGEEAPDDTFLARLSKGHGCPFWLRPVYYPAPESEALKDDFILVYEVVPEQSREEAALRFGQLLLERGELENAENFFNTLVRHYDSYLPGWVSLAQTELGLGHDEAFRAAMAHVAELQVSATGLEFDDRLNLAAVLATVGDTEGFRRQFRQCVEVADESALRKLSPNMLLCFVLFAKDTGEAENHAEILHLATDLLPAEMLKQVQAPSAAH